MSQLTSAPPDLRAATPAELTLRVCGTAQDGRLVRLRGANCTVGSDSQCTLRLRATGVAALHCLILRGAERTVVRSLSGVTRINGRDISEANLEVGDRLTIGTIEFEVADGAPKNWGADGPIDEKSSVKSSGHDSAPPRNVDSLMAERKETARQGRVRARRLLVQLREVRRENELNNLRLARLEESGDRLARELAESQAERQRLCDVQAKQEASAQTDDEIRRQIEEQRKTLEQERAALDQERGRLEQAHTAIHEERRAFDEERSGLDQQRSSLDQLKEQIEQERSALAQAQQQIEQQREAVLLARQQLEQERAADIQEREAVAQERAAIEQQRISLVRERSTVESQHMLFQQELRAFEEHKHALTAERLDWQSEASRAEAALAGRREELDQRAVAIEKQHSEQEAARRRLEETQKALAKRQETLQQAENDLLERKRQGQEQEQALVAVRKTLDQHRAQLDADRQALAQEQAALAGQRQEIVDLSQDEKAIEEEWSRRLAEQARQLTEATERLKVATKELANQQSMVEAVRQEQDEERQQWDTQRARLRFEYEEQLAALRPGVNRPHVQSLRSPADEPLSPRDAALPAESEIEDRPGEPLEGSAIANTGDAVADRSGNSVSDNSDVAVAGNIDEHFELATSDEEVVTCQDGRPQEELSFLPDEPPTEPAADSIIKTPRETDEESIDDYMTRLLKRVQNIGQRHRPAAGNAPPATAAAPIAPSEQNGDAATVEAGESSAVQEVLARLSRRTAAPELSSDIAAMRELANLSARAAIDKHAYRNWGRAAFGKLTIAVLAAAAGVGAVHFAVAPDSMLMYAGLLSFVIALFWLLQAGILMKNVFQASRRQARMAQAINEKTPLDESQEHAPEADEPPPAEIISVCDGEGQTSTPAGSR